MSNIAIEFQSVGKMYRLGRVGTGTLSHDLNRWWQTTILGKEDPYLKIGQTNDRTVKGDSDYVWALRDISFKVEQGEVLGIIGKNGAGKSTLLKLLSHITAPTTGKITYEGRIASLLEVGTGFHPEMTGRENIYMNGSIMGMTKREITRKLDAIVDFAGIERYLDTPVKRYSSGMTVRLGFSVAAFLEPEILVVDEVLAVGDAEFQKKAIGKMQDVSRGEGRTVLFVSHNMSAVRSLCSQGIVLDQGSLCFDGCVTDAIDFYQSSNSSSFVGREILDHLSWKKSYIQLSTVRINGQESDTSIIRNGQESLQVEILGETSEAFDCNINLKLRSISGMALMTYAPGAYRGELFHIGIGAFHIVAHIPLPPYLSRGEVICDLWVHRPQFDNYIKLDSCCRMQMEGGCDSCCLPLNLSDDGLCGF